jgi:hypothetical protein
MSVSCRPFSVVSPIHSIFTPPQLALEVEWYRIRDMAFGQNFVVQDVPRALELAAACEHPDAKYLTNVFAGKTVKTKEEARNVLLAQPETDSRAICFAELVLTCDNGGWNMLRMTLSAEFGFAFAQAFMAAATEGEERFKFAQASAAQRERDGFLWLGHCFSLSFGCEKNLLEGKRNYVIAAEMGLVNGMGCIGMSLDKTDPHCWVWLGLASQKGNYTFFIQNMPKMVTDLRSGRGNASCVFEIGRALSAHINEEREEIFGKYYRSNDKCVRAAKDAVSFYKAQLAAYREAVHVWSLTALRFGVAKEIRILIAKTIWELRNLAEYRKRI